MVLYATCRKGLGKNPDGAVTGVVSNAEKFSGIYRSHQWRGVSRSGPGSDPDLVRPYLEILNDILRDPRLGIRSVVDVGCGDWSLGRRIDWEGFEYTGIDVVPELVGSLNEEFASDTIRFRCMDLTRDDLPRGDLLIVKDVLQHLPNAAIHAFLAQLGRHRYALLTNDCRIMRPSVFSFGLLLRDTRKPNGDIPNGSARPLFLTKAPFDLQASEVRRFDVVYEGTTFRKQALLWTNPDTGDAAKGNPQT